MCFQKLALPKIQSHISKCEFRVKDEEMVTCKYCNYPMKKVELADHAVAHLLHQNQVEKQLVERVADVEDFFETEALVPSGVGRAPLMDKKQLKDLPTYRFKVNKQSQQAKEDGEAVIANSLKCAICQMEFVQNETLRTLRCLHIFHRKCIDKWLSEVNGCCVICKVVQSKPKPRQTALQGAIQAAATAHLRQPELV